MVEIQTRRGDDYISTLREARQIDASKCYPTALYFHPEVDQRSFSMYRKCEVLLRAAVPRVAGGRQLPLKLPYCLPLYLFCF
jgi:hypothetical protein